MANGVRVSEQELRGWTILRLGSDVLEADVIPGKGGDILQVRWLPLGIPLLWSTPWGLRARGSVRVATDPYANFMHGYPGGWQTIFPNGGRASTVAGAEQPFHGEACLVAWDHEPAPDGVALRTRLTLSPFELTKTITMRGARLEVEETARNVGAEPFEVMWSHHPAFGPPFLDGDCRLDVAANTVVTDEGHPSDLAAGRRSAWPHAEAPGGLVDLRRVPAAGSGVTRLAYVTDLDRGFASIMSRSQRLRAELEWSTDVFSHAWLWVEANASDGFPTYGSWYVMAIEPASSFPGHGIDAARAAGTLLPFEPGEERTAKVSLTVMAL